MDWERIERDVLSHTQALAVGGGGSYLNERFRMSSSSKQSLHGSGLGVRSSGSGSDSLGQIAHPPVPALPPPSTDLPSTMMRELAELRQTTQQQGKRMAMLEKMLTSCSESLDAVNNAQFSSSERLETLEHEQRVIATSTAHSSRERAELNIQSKTLTGRQQALEEAIRGQENQYASKESFAQLLDTTVEQVRALSVLSESARQRSTQSIALTEALIQALYELNSGPSGFRLDFLSSLSSGEQQRDQIVKLLIDALQQAISVSVRNQFTPAIECMANLFRPQMESLKRQHEEMTEELKARMTAVQSSLQSRVERTTESSARLEAAVHDCEKTALECSSDVHKLKEIHAATVSSIQGLRESQATQRSAIVALTATQQQRQTHESDRAAMRETLRTLSSTVDGLGEGVHSLRLDVDAKVAEILRGQERIRSQEAERARKTERLEGQLKGDLGTVGLSQQSLQQQFDQFVRDISTRTVELDRSFSDITRELDAIRRREKDNAVVSGGGGGGGGSGSPVRSTAPAVLKAAEISELETSLGALSQSLATLTLDVDDIKSQYSEFKSAFRAVDEDFGRLTKRTSDSVSAVKEGMDALQSEVVSMSETLGSVQPALAKNEAKIIALKQEVLRLAAASSSSSSSSSLASASATKNTSPSPASTTTTPTPSKKGWGSVKASFADHTLASASKTLPQAAPTTNTPINSTSPAKSRIVAVAGPPLSAVVTSKVSARRTSVSTAASTPTGTATASSKAGTKNKGSATKPKAVKAGSAAKNSSASSQVDMGVEGGESGSDFEQSFLADSPNEDEGEGGGDDNSDSTGDVESFDADDCDDEEGQE